MDWVDFPREDIQCLRFDDCSYDLVLANHVLEHVENDGLALSEVARILSKNGKAIFTIPGDWRRVETKIFPNLDFNGHYRDYGLDIIDLMKTVFSKVKVCNLFQFDGIKHAIKKDEIAFHMHKMKIGLVLSNVPGLSETFIVSKIVGLQKLGMRFYFSLMAN